MSKPYKVQLTAKTSKAKMALIGFYVILLFMFAFLDIAVNSYWGKELDGWTKTYIIPIKTFLGFFGEVTVADYWLFYAQSMFAFFFLLFLMPFMLTRQKRWIPFALGMSLMAVALEDYFAHLLVGKVMPEWEGPAAMGFIGGIPTFYFVTFIPGAFILLLWTFYEVRTYRMIGDFARKTGRAAAQPSRILSKGSVSNRRFNNYRPRKTTVRKKMKRR